MRLHSHEWGDRDNPLVVCLHGIGAHGGRFARLASCLPESHVVAFDLRGHGRSSFEPPWTISTLVSDVLESAEPLAVEPVAWVGHSLGGRIVLEIASRHPDRAEKIALLDPAIRLRPDLAFALADSARTDHVFPTAAEAVPPLFAGALFRTPEEMLAAERSEHLEPCAGGYRWRFSPSAVVAILGELATWAPPPEQLPQRVLMVLGTEESVVGPRQLHRFEAALGDRLRVVRVPGGHVVYWDAFDETAAALGSFFEHASPSDGSVDPQT